MTATAVPANMMPSKHASVYQNAQAITPADNVAIGPFSAFMVGVAGNVAIVPRNGDGNNGVTPTTLACIPGWIYPIAIQCVMATNTTATGIVGLG